MASDAYKCDMKRITRLLFFALLFTAVSVAQESDSTKEDFLGEIIIGPKAAISSKVTTLELSINLPKGYRFVAEAPFQFAVSSDDTGVVKIDSTRTKTPANLVIFPIAAKSGKAILQIDMNLFYCSTGKDAVCFPKLVRLVLPVEVTRDGAEKLAARYTVDTGL